MSDDDLSQQDIALVHLVCAAGLPGTEDLDIPQCLAKIDDWTELVREETIRGFPRYLANPRPNKGSEAVYRLWAVMYHLRFGLNLKFVRIAKENGDPDAQPRRVTGGPYASAADADTIFIHGLLSPRRMGTCSSFPVLYAAVARRLGYPVKLVLTVQHVFNRWVSPEESFNMDGCARVIGNDDYDYYIDWPRKWRPDEKASTAFLRPATPREELAAFVFMRSVGLSANLEFDEALRVCKIASELSPENPAYTNELQTIEGYREKKLFGFRISREEALQSSELLTLDVPQMPDFQTSFQYSLPAMPGMNGQQYTIIEVPAHDHGHTAPKENDDQARPPRPDGRRH